MSPAGKKQGKISTSEFTPLNQGVFMDTACPAAEKNAKGFLFIYDIFHEERNQKRRKRK